MYHKTKGWQGPLQPWFDPRLHDFKFCREDAACPLCDVCGCYPTAHMENDTWSS